jgi:anthranilate phosphoribosyltransferase
MAALGGERGPTYDSLVLAAAIVLNHLRRFDDLAPAADYVRSVLDSGAAVKRVG